MDKFGTAVLLAGGKSKRMGFDKQLIEINGTKLIEHIIDSLQTEFNEIIIVTNDFDYYSNSKIILVSDEIPNQGPLGGILTGLRKSNNQYIYLLACDMPIINIEYIRFMKEKIGLVEYDACITQKENWIEPFNSFYSKSLILNLEKHLASERTSLYSFLKDLNCLYIKENEARQFSNDWSMFQNLNTPNELSSYINNK